MEPGGAQSHPTPDRKTRVRRSLQPNVNSLVAIYFVDNSKKTLQTDENCTVEDLLLQLKYNLDMKDISTFAIYKLIGSSVHRLQLSEKVNDIIKGSDEMKLLFKTWISYPYGHYGKEVFQYGSKTKVATSELWLAYMEATDMMIRGKYYLTFEESLQLGCIQLQIESSDYSSAKHTACIIKDRIINRFPEPCRSKMISLVHPVSKQNKPSSNSEEAIDKLIDKVVLTYSRLAGKRKVEAQIDYLQILRICCPFYGSTFFNVQAQYDDKPLDASNYPPVIDMEIAVGPLAICLVSKGDGNTVAILRHTYRRIIKWVAHVDKNIFSYWVLKPDKKMSDILEGTDEDSIDLSLQGDIDIAKYCDCVYIVTQHTAELEYLIRSYVTLERDNIEPSLPHASRDLLPYKGEPVVEGLKSCDVTSSSNVAELSTPIFPLDIATAPTEIATTPPKTNIRRFSNIFGFIGRGESTQGTEIVGTGYSRNDPDVTSPSENINVSPLPKYEGPSIPQHIKVASTFPELKKLSEEQNFTDDDDDDDEIEGKEEKEEGDDDVGRPEPVKKRFSFF